MLKPVNFNLFVKLFVFISKKKNLTKGDFEFEILKIPMVAWLQKTPYTQLFLVFLVFKIFQTYFRAYLCETVKHVQWVFFQSKVSGLETRAKRL